MLSGRRLSIFEAAHWPYAMKALVKPVCNRNCHEHAWLYVIEARLKPVCDRICHKHLAGLRDISFTLACGVVGITPSLRNDVGREQHVNRDTKEILYEKIPRVIHLPVKHAHQKEKCATTE